MNDKQFKSHATEAKDKTEDRRKEPNTKADKVDRGGAKVGDMNGEAKQTKK